MVDYKTDALPATASVEEAAARYRLQGAAYALALQETLGRPVTRCVFLFTSAAGPREAPVPNLPAAMEEVRRIAPLVG